MSCCLNCCGCSHARHRRRRHRRIDIPLRCLSSSGPDSSRRGCVPGRGTSDVEGLCTLPPSRGQLDHTGKSVRPISTHHKIKNTNCVHIWVSYKSRKPSHIFSLRIKCTCENSPLAKQFLVKMHMARGRQTSSPSAWIRRQYPNIRLPSMSVLKHIKNLFNDIKISS